MSAAFAASLADDADDLPRHDAGVEVFGHECSDEALEVAAANPKAVPTYLYLTYCFGCTP